MSDDLLDIHLGIKGTADDVARIVQGITGLLIDAEGVKWSINVDNNADEPHMQAHHPDLFS